VIGRHIGPYQVVEKLGEGGMGVVYLARDPRLNRQVALKCLGPDAPSDPERRRRFLQEAQAASSLNHPGIVTVYDFANADGQDVIAMEYVRGVSLDRLLTPEGRQRPLRLADAIGYAVQVADALGAAHAAGIVHRDLKPANIMVTESGATKIVDFGLAKLALPAAFAGSNSADQVATMPMASPATERGVILGTVAYMSPEQAEGRPVDRRSDIFSFGTILFEMVSGRRPFAGDTPMSTLAGIVQGHAPPLATIVPGNPELAKVVDRCLRKDPARRWQHIDDVRVALAEIKDALDSGAPPQVEAPSRTGGRRIAPLLAAAAVGGLAAGGLIVWAARPGAPLPAAVPTLTRLTADDGLTTEPALSLDGRLVAYASDRASSNEMGGNTDIWVQQVAGGQAIRLTQDAADDHEPSFSPDGSKVVFRSDRNGGGLYVVSALGGDPRLLAQGGHFPRYSPDGKWIAYWDGEPASGILFVSGDARIWVIPADGGNPRAVGHEFALAYPPMWSADATRVVFWGRRQAEEPYDMWSVEVEGEGTPVQIGARAALASQAIDSPQLVSALTAANHWIFSSGRGLWRLTIDPSTWKGADRLEGITFGASSDSTPSAASDGSIAFESRTTSVGVWSLPIDANRMRVTGTATRITSGTSRHSRPFVTKNGAHVVFSTDRSGNDDVWTKDMTTGIERAVVATSATELAGSLSPDTTMIAYTGGGSDVGALRVGSVAGGATKSVCAGCDAWFEWISSGQALLGIARRSGRFGAVLVTPEGQERWYLTHSQHNIFGPRLSPDQRWIALSLNQGQGRAAVWIVPVEAGRPAAESNWIRVTEETGTFADKQDWSPDGNVLYYYSARDGFGCIYAQRLDPATKKPGGPPVAVSHWHSARRSLRTVGLGILNLSVGADKLVFNLAERTGNVWLLGRTGGQ
jgi:Tol biopolymer transport system component/predicted Ser/Thr protein kinase